MAFKVSLSPEEPTIVATEKIKFTATVSGQNGTVSYVWKVDNVVQEGENASTFVFNPDSKVGSFTVKVEATDETPETVSDSEVVETISLAPIVEELAKIRRAVA